MCSSAATEIQFAGRQYISRIGGYFQFSERISKNASGCGKGSRIKSKGSGYDTSFFFFFLFSCGVETPDIQVRVQIGGDLPLDWDPSYRTSINYH